MTGPARPPHPHHIRTEESAAVSDHDAEHPDAWTEPSAHTGPPRRTRLPPRRTGPTPRTALRTPALPCRRAAGQTAVTPADAADAARLVSFGLQPKLLPARDAEYADLLRRYREESSFARLADAVATGLGLVVLEVSPRAGMAVTAGEDSVFAVRMGDYARRASSDAADRFLHGLAHSPSPPSPSRPPEDLADDALHRPHHGQRRRRLRTPGLPTAGGARRGAGRQHRPRQRRPGLEAGWRIYARRSSTGATKDARRLAGSTTGIIGKAVAFLTDSGFLQRTGDDAGGAYRTTARYQLQVRDLAGSARHGELLELGVVPVTDGSATLLPPPDPDSVELAADAGLPFHS